MTVKETIIELEQIQHRLSEELVYNNQSLIEDIWEYQGNGKPLKDQDQFDVLKMCDTSCEDQLRITIDSIQNTLSGLNELLAVENERIKKYPEIYL